MSIKQASYSLRTKITIFFLGFVFSWAVLGSYRTFAKGLWVQKNDGLSNGEWEKIRSSADGNELVGIFQNYSDGLYYVEYSDDDGESWRDITPNDPDVDDLDEFDSGLPQRHIWSDVDMSGDGDTVVVADDNSANGHSYIWYTPNAGGIWSRENNDGQPGTSDWSGVTVGNDGQYVAATDGSVGHHVWTSTDYGNSWNSTEPAAGKDWEALSYSPNGDYLVAAESTSGYIWVSQNQGTDWSPDAPSVLPWKQIAVANDGTIIASADDNTPEVGKVSEGGYDWTDTGFSSDGEHLIGISGDGLKLMTRDSSGYIYTADATDVTDWHAENLLINGWKTLALDDDGLRMVAAGYLTEVWTSTDDATAPTVVSVSPANGATNVAVDAPLVITFSEPMYNDIDIESPPCDGDACPEFDQSWSEDSTQVTLTKNDGPFTKATDYTISIIAVDVAGNELDEPYEWSFTTMGDAPAHHTGGHSSMMTPPTHIVTVASPTLVSTSTTSTTVQTGASVVPLIKTISHDLEFGMTGPEVTILQQFLIAEAKGPAALALKNHGTTDFFGVLTRAALAEWQFSEGITPSAGYFGPKTRAAIATSID